MHSNDKISIGSDVLWISDRNDCQAIKTICSGLYIPIGHSDQYGFRLITVCPPGNHYRFRGRAFSECGALCVVPLSKGEVAYDDSLCTFPMARESDMEGHAFPGAKCSLHLGGGGVLDGVVATRHAWGKVNQRLYENLLFILPDPDPAGAALIAGMPITARNIDGEEMLIAVCIGFKEIDVDGEMIQYVVAFPVTGIHGFQEVNQLTMNAFEKLMKNDALASISIEYNEKATIESIALEERGEWPGLERHVDSEKEIAA